LNPSQVKISVAAQETAEVVYGSVRDHGDGNYTVSLRPTRKGAYTLSITLDGQHVARSP